jgi:hypothetical protein
LSTSPRIERGAALLDEHAPVWPTKINLDTLNLSDCTYCVLGQVYGDYEDGLRALDGEAETSPERFGFEARGDEEYASLTAKWILYLARRLRR